MGHGHRHPVRLPAQLYVRRRKGKKKTAFSIFLIQTLLTAHATQQSNYFKGSILLLTYLVVIVGFYLAGYSSDLDVLGIDRFDTLAIGRETFKTIGKGRSGRAY